MAILLGQAHFIEAAKQLRILTKRREFLAMRKGSRSIFMLLFAALLWLQ